MGEEEKAYRQAYWEELPQELKIEGLKEVVKMQHRLIEEMAEKLDSLSAHVHADGQIWKPLNYNDGHPMDYGRMRGHRFLFNERPKE